MITYASGNPSKVTIVNGKLHPVATGAADVTATIAGDDNHNGTTATIRVTVSEKEDVSSAVMFEAQTGPFTYSDTPAALSTYVNAATITDGTLTNPKAVVYRLDGEVVDSLNVTKVLDAGEHTFTATFEDDTKIGVGTVKITIEKATLTPTVTWKVGDAAYDDTNGVTYTGAVQTITPTVADTEKYEVVTNSATGNSQTNAGDSYEAKVKLQVKADSSTNYKLAGAGADGTVEVSKTWKIAKAPAPTLAKQTVQVRYNDNKQAKEYTTAQIAALAPEGASFGTITVKNATKGTGNYLATAEKNAAGNVSYQLASDVSDPGLNATFKQEITITFDSTNYAETTLTLEVEITSRTVVPAETGFPNYKDKNDAVYTGLEQKHEGAVYAGPKAATAGTVTYKYAAVPAGADPVEVKNVGEYNVTATYTDDEYTCSKTVKLTIKKATLTISGAELDEKIYDGNPDVDVTSVTLGTVNSETLDKGTDYTVTAAFADANAGKTKAVTVTVVLGSTDKANNYALANEGKYQMTGEIKQKTLTADAIDLASSDPITFNNAKQTPAIAVKDNGTAIAASEYTVVYPEESTNAGTYTAKVTATEGGNYTFDEKDVSYTIAKATATVANVNATGKAGTEVSIKLPELTNPGTDPAVMYEAQVATDNDGILEDEASISGSTLICKIASAATEGQTATIPVKITSQNYTDTTVSVVVTATKKDIPQVTAQDVVKTYNNAALTLDEITKSNSVDGEWSFVGDVIGVKNANTMPYDVTLKFAPTETDDYAAVEVQIKVTINKATPTVTPTFTPITEAGKTLANAPLDCTSEPAGSIAWDDPADTVVVANQSYGWTFTPDDATNYETATGTLIPFVQTPPDETEDPVLPILPPSGGNGSGSTGGGTGGSGSGSGNQGGTTTNPDQSVTTTTTDRDGNVTTTTTYPDGSKSVVEMKTDGTIISTDTDAQGNTATVTQNPDGSSVKTVENIDGSSSIQNTTSDGQTSAMVNLPSETVDASNASGAPASLPMDAVTATKDSATAPVVMVNTANDEPVKVEIPVTNANNGTVAVLVKADGTEEIIKTTALTSDGVAVTVNSGDTVKIIDNTKTFSDTATHWGSDAVTFVAARELFSGTSETRFSPDDNMTRGMLMTVLARYENVDTNGGSVWYEKGVAWAVAQGLSDGTNPTGQISREQLATIIYRYAQSKGIDTTAGGSLERFPDAGSVSDWAREAMSWAVGNGIISGVGGVTLDPSGNATRAQVATILMRFSEKFPA